MNPNLETALENIDFICKRISLPRDQHDQLKADIALIREACEPKKDKE